MPKFTDIHITCLCGKVFNWTAGEQKFMNQLLQNKKIRKATKPLRCQECRARKKKKIEAGESFD